MALASLANPMYAQLQAALPLMISALNAKRAAVTRKLSAAAKAGAVTPDVRTELTKALTAEADPKLNPSIPRVVSFQTTTNFSNLGIADAAVRGTFAIGDGAQADRGRVLESPCRLRTTPTSRSPASTTYGSTCPAASTPASAAGTATAGNANAVAAKAVGPTTAGPGLPPIPAASLIGKLRALPATWSAAGSALESAVTPDAFAKVMSEGLKSAAAASALVAASRDSSPATPRPRSAPLDRSTVGRTSSCRTAATAAAKQVAADLITKAVQPTLAASVADLQSAIAGEVTTLLSTPPAGMAAAGPADPQMAAIVTAMKGRLDADKAATAGTGIDPTAPTQPRGAAAPSQDVSYSAQGLMGSSNSTKVRTDQFEKMLAAFNAEAAQEAAGGRVQGGGRCLVVTDVTVRWSTPSAAVDERLRVSSNGDARLLALAPLRDATLIGEFRGEVSADELEALAATGTRVSIDPTHTESAEVGAVSTLASQVADRCRADPLAAGLFVFRSTGPAVDGVRPLVLGVVGRGERACQFLLDLPGCRIRFVTDGSQVGEVPLPELAAGFMTSDAEGLGGVRTDRRGAAGHPRRDRAGRAGPGAGLVRRRSSWSEPGIPSTSTRPRHRRSGSPPGPWPS